MESNRIGGHYTSETLAEAISGRILVYPRVSDGPGQEGNLSWEYQCKRLVEMLIQLGADPELLKVYDDEAKSSLRGHRIGWTEMNDDIVADPSLPGPRITAVAMNEFSRFGRNPIEVLTFLDNVKKRGIYVIENGVVRDLRIDSDWLLAAIQAVLAAGEVLRLARRIRDAKATKLQDGFSVSRLPAGLERDGEGFTRLAADPAEREAIARVWREALA